MAFVWDIEKQIVFNTGFSKEEAQKIAKIAFRIKEDYFRDLIEFTKSNAVFCAPYNEFPNGLLDKVYTFDCMDKPLPENILNRAKRLCSEIDLRLHSIDDPFYKYTHTEVEEGKGWYQIVTKLDQSAYGRYAYKQIIPIVNSEEFKANYNGSPQLLIRKVEEASLLLEGSFDDNKKIIQNIIKEVAPKAYKILDQFTKKSKFDYLADKKYILPNYKYIYELSTDEDEANEFGRIILLSIDINKIKNPESFDWVSWEDDVYDLCKELQKDPDISKYGKVNTEQPDDGGQIYLTINRKFLKIPNDYADQKSKRDKEIEEEKRKHEKELKQKDKENEIIYKYIKKNRDKLIQETKKDIENNFVHILKGEYSKIDNKNQLKMEYKDYPYRDDMLIECGFKILIITKNTNNENKKELTKNLNNAIKNIDKLDKLKNHYYIRESRVYYNDTGIEKYIYFEMTNDSIKEYINKEAK